MYAEELNCLDPEEIHFKIEEKYKRAKIAALYTNTLIRGLEMGLPSKFAYKIAIGGNLSNGEIKELDIILKKKQKKNSSKSQLIMYFHQCSSKSSPVGDGAL